MIDGCVMSIKQRFHYIDALRVLALFLIILYHYETDIITSGLFDLQAAGIHYETANIHMAKVGVTLFFMVSGFGLMLSSLHSFSVKEFVKKRVVRIYIPFYVVSVLVYLAKRVMTDGPVFAGIPAWHIIYTILGLDGYLAEYGVATFSLGVGEWFIGCMVGMYLCFPALRWAMKKNANVTILIATACYMVIVAVYQGVVPSHYFFFIKIYDFILGMYFAVRLQLKDLQNVQEARENRMSWRTWMRPVCVICLVVLLLLPVTVPVKVEYVHSVFSAIVFLCAFWLESVPFARRIFAGKPIAMISKYSYEMFLIHHWGLIMMNRVIKPQSVGMVFVCFVVEFVVILAGGMILKECIDWCCHKVKKD